MGLFDRFRSAGPAFANSNASMATTAEQGATRLIEEGHTLEAEGKLDKAMQCYLEAIRVAPNPARAHLNCGNILLLQGDLPGALDAFKTALKHKPDYAGAYYNIGNALLGNRQIDKAVASYRNALEIKPDYAEVHCSLGVALKELGQLDEAVDCFRRALTIEPELSQARNNLGMALQHYYNTGIQLLNAGKPEEAATNFRNALAIEPNLAEAHFNLGNAIQELEQHEAAVASYQCALALKSDYVEALNNMGNALRNLARLDDAVENYQRALKLKPDYAEVHSNLGNTLQDLGQLDDAIASQQRALAIKPDYFDAHHALLFALNYDISHASSYYLEQARQFGLIATEKAEARYATWQCAARPERLRVGLVSGDLLSHPVGFFLEGLLAHIDPARIELIAYPTHHREDELTARIRPYFSAWQPLFGINDRDAARLIHAGSVHILIDLSGHTGHNRLPMFAWKPAPVQASWLGYFTTTGVAEIDYFLADEVGVPREQQAQFTESVWYLPDTRLSFTAPGFDLPVTPLPALTSGMITFGCFQNLTKLGNDVLELWAKILDALPDARLRIQYKQLNQPAPAEQLLHRFQRYGIARDRLMLHGPTKRAAYLAAHSEVDIILDTFPYTGGTTTCEGLWMGVPTLTLAGKSLLARQGASLLTAAGLEQWIANSKEEYVAKAIALASDHAGLAALRSVLREQVLASPLFDAPRFARNFEDALWGMWARYQAQQQNPEIS